jgi:hypothetical protein
MIVRRTKEATLAPRLSLRWGVSLAGAVLIALVFGVSSAPASPLGKVVESVESVVPPVAAPSTPSLPSAPSATPPQAPVPSVPKAPVDVPTVPQAPVDTSPAPQVPPVKAPGGTRKAPGGTRTPPLSLPLPSGGSTKPSDPGIDLASVDEKADGITQSAGTPTGASAAGARQTATSARNGVGNDPSRPGATRPGIEAGHVESAKIAPLRRLLAYVWPAIALGSAGELLATLQTRWGVAALLAMSDISAVPRLLSGLTRASGTGGVAGVSEHSGTSNPSPANYIDTWVLDNSGISILVFLISCAALVALLAFTVRRELRSSVTRWRV